MNIIQAFEATLSSDNNIRNQGEYVLDQLVSQPEQLPNIIQIGNVNSQQKDDIRKSAMLCFSRTINKINNFNQIPQQILVQISNELLNNIKVETSLELKGALSASISLFAQCMEDNQMKWNNYFGELFKFMQDQRLLQQMIALDALSSSMTFEDSHQLSQLSKQIVDYCMQQLSLNNLQMTLSILSFLGSAIIFLETEKQDAVYTQQLLPAVMNSLMKMLEGGFFDEYDIATSSFGDIIENCDFFVEGKEIEIAQQMFNICCQAQKKETQQSSIEVIVLLMEHNERVFKSNPITHNVVLKLLEWLSSIDQTTAECILNDEDPVDIENCIYAEDAFIRVVASVGGAPIKDLLFNKSVEYLNSNSWNDRYAALVALSLSVQPGKFIFKNTTSQLLKLVINFVNDPNPLVLLVLLDLMEELISAFPKMCRRRHFDEIIQVVICSLSSPCFTVQDKACYVLNALFEKDEDTKQKLTPYVPNLMDSIFKAVLSQNFKVISSAISIITFISKVMEREMNVYYGTLKQMIEGLLPVCTTKDSLEIKGKLIELMCMYSVFDNNFFPDSRNILFSTLQELCNSPDVGSPLFGFVLSGLIHLSDAKDSQFCQFLPQILQLLLNRLTMKQNEGPIVNGIQESNSEISVHNLYSEEKCFLLNTLFQISSSLKEQMGPFIQNILQILVPMLTDVNNDVKELVAHVIPSIYENGLSFLKSQNADPISVKQNIQPLYYVIVDTICESLKKEKFTDNIKELLFCLKMLLCLSGNDSLTEDKIGLIFESLDEVLKKILDEVGLENDGDVAIEDGNFDVNELDDEEYERIQEQIEDDDDWLSLLTDIISYVCQSHQSTFFQPFQFKLFPRIMTYFGQNKDNDKLSFAIAVIGCVISDGKIYDFLPNVCDNFIQFSVNENIDIANNAIYFLGEFAKNEIPQFLNFVPNVLQYVGQNLNRKRSKAAVQLRDQVLLCVGHIVCHFSNKVSIDIPSIMTQWIQLFPANGSYSEIIQLMIDLQQAGILQPTLQQGDLMENIFRIVSYFAQALENERTEDSCKTNIIKLINFIYNFVPQNIIGGVWNKLTIEQRSDLDTLLSKK